MYSIDASVLKETLTVMKKLTNRAPAYIMTFARLVVCDGVIVLESFNGSSMISRIIGHCDNQTDDVSFGLPIAQALSVLKPANCLGMVDIEPGRVVVNGMSVTLDKCDVIDPWPVFVSVVDSPVAVTMEDMNRICGVAYAASMDSSRFNLDTVCIDDSVVVSTDGARLAHVNLSVSFGGDIGLIVINRDVVVLMATMFGNRRDVTTMWSIFDDYLVVKSPSWTIRCERLSTYPEYKRVLMEGNYEPERVYNVDRKQLLSALKMIKPLTDKKDRSVRVSLKGNQMVISRNGSECSVPTVAISGKAIDRSWLVNMMFLVDALSSGNDKIVSIAEYIERRIITVTNSDGSYGLIMLLYGSDQKK